MSGPGQGAGATGMRPSSHVLLRVHSKFLSRGSPWRSSEVTLDLISAIEVWNTIDHTEILAPSRPFQELTELLLAELTLSRRPMLLLV